MDTTEVAITRNKTAEVMFPLVEEFLQVGTNLKSFCEGHNLTYHGFQYWLRKYRKEQEPESSKEASFLPVKVKQRNVIFGGAEIEYADGTKIRFSENTTAEYVKNFIPGLLR